SIEETFEMPKSWAFSENAKFGKKRGGKKLKTKVVGFLKQFFLNENLNPKDRMTAKDIHEELLKFANSDEIKEKHVPKVTTIQNWIGRYTKEFNKEGTVITLETFKNKYGAHLSSHIGDSN
ncbi:3538_t:CDS:2, partial [Cetraspora pellucida]